MNLEARISVHLARRGKELMNCLQAWLTRLESRTETPYQMLLINRLTKVTDDPILQGADPLNVIGVGSNEDCRNRVPASMRCL